MNKPTLRAHLLECVNPTKKDKINESWCLEHASNSTGVTLKTHFKPCHTQHKYMDWYRQYLIYVTTFNLQSSLCLLYVKNIFLHIFTWSEHAPTFSKYNYIHMTIWGTKPCPDCCLWDFCHWLHGVKKVHTVFSLLFPDLLAIFFSDLVLHYT